MVNSSPAQLDRVFHALSDPTRRAMVARLSKGEATVSTLAAPFTTSLPAISKHLRVLEEAGLVKRAVRGREHHCSLEPRPLETAAEWIEYHQRFWETRLDALEDLLTSDAPRPKRTNRRSTL
ncbi:MAG TPA: metalloregulator ArsR/SmtB family transcription factor [Gemmatimonadales bacterium]|nr:metalloregulator ArsR/SmtB family transcription factor [Gemmatimonadales bacterium]